MLSRRRTLFAGLVAAAVAAAVLIALVVSDDSEPAPPPDLPGAAEQELSFLPSRFPPAIARDVTDADVSMRGERIFIRLTLSRRGNPTDAVFFYSERLRDAGWQVTPSADSSRASFRGFGWEGEAISEREGSRSETVVELEGKPDQ